MLKEIANNNLPITRIMQNISLEEKVPEATLRFNAKKLQGLGLIEAGDRLNKGKKAELTFLGKIIYEILNGREKNLEIKHFSPNENYKKSNYEIG